eukprot:5313272-Prymnesium_polylepis.3
MASIELALILLYLCVLLIKSCDNAPEQCSSFGFGDSATGEHWHASKARWQPLRSTFTFGTKASSKGDTLWS